MQVPERFLGKDIVYLYITDWWDGPLSGVIIFECKPYYFHLEYEDESFTRTRTFNAYDMPESFWHKELEGHRRWNENCGNYSYDLKKEYKPSRKNYVPDKHIESNDNPLELDGKLAFYFKD